MMRLYLGGAVGLALFGQQTSGDAGALIDQALAQEPNLGTILHESGKLVGLGVQPHDAALIVAGCGVAWKVLDTLQKSGAPDTANRWLARKLGVDNNPPSPPRS